MTVKFLQKTLEILKQSLNLEPIRGANPITISSLGARRPL
jgi:hypothetical protein